jgi:hypothetical protein
MKTDELSDRLKRALRFGSFTEAERSLRTIHDLFTECRHAADRRGMELCRQRALAGKKRTLFISRNPHVDPRKQMQKKEMHMWFSLWLENPDAFFTWLDIRKKTETFQSLARDDRANGKISGCGKDT